ncbi:MAG: helix-turn-helix domain-containing protein [Chitinophagaceae bacterium]|nr:helix-turn-helix domain-containing protein [Chitinophagaceae bacterium]
MPFSTLTKIIPLPDKRPYPKELQHIGHHLKKARLERSLLIKDVLAILNVDRETLRAWETGIWKPFARHYPKIIRFLGYDPFPHETKTLGGRIKTYRHQHGLSQEQFASLVHTDRSTVCIWETNQRLPVAETIRAIEKIIGYV